MNIKSTQLNTNNFQRPKVAPSNGQSDTFFIDLDPLGGVKRFVADTVDLGMTFGMGAVPGLGAKHHGEMAIIGGFSGRSNSDTRWAAGGAALNAAGTVGLLIAGGQHLLGGDPTTALYASAAALAGSGAISVALMH